MENETVRTIDMAIHNTLVAHPDFAQHLTAIIYENTREIDLYNFTSQANARKSMSKLDSKDIIHYTINQAILIYGAIEALYPIIISTGRANYETLNKIQKQFPGFRNIINEVNFMLENKNLNLINFYQLNPMRLYGLVYAVSSTMFNPEFYYSKEKAENSKNTRANLTTLGYKSKTSGQLLNRLNKEYQSLRHVSKMQINYDACNKCLDEVLKGSQVKHNTINYAYEGQLFASQHINGRVEQQDSTVYLVHPENKDFKFIAVADGMGGQIDGGKISNYVVKRLAEWFHSLPKDLYYDPTELINQYKKIIALINEEVYDKYKGNGGSTLVGAIITDKNTIIANVGDSRAYITTGGYLQQVTDDESLVWNEMVRKARREKRGITTQDIDNLRYARDNHMILNCIGMDPEGRKQLQIRNIQNSYYDKLLLFSDGVHDVLSTSEIEMICNSTNPKDITKALVEMTISSKGKKDNVTASAYIRR